MKYSADFRSIARGSLRGKWLFAVAAGLVAVLLGGISSDGPEIKFHIDAAGWQAPVWSLQDRIFILLAKDWDRS